jgi:hypothetical protein
MRRTSVLPLIAVFLLAAAPAFSQDKAAAAKDQPAAFELFKQLAGDWTGKEAGGHVGGDVHVKYKVTSGGSAVVETIFPDKEQEMVTVIHPDGNDLVLTHYCMLGNQPHMKAEGKPDSNKVAFKFTGCSNLKSDKDMHMHDATFTFVDKDNIKVEWTHYMDGKPSGAAVFELKRNK